MSFTVVSYYTPEYEQEANRLRISLDKFDIHAVLSCSRSAGSWVANCAMKPEFIRNQAESLGAVLWLDADAEVLGELSLFERTETDFAVRRRFGNIAKSHGPFMSGTLYFSGPQSLLDGWVEEQRQHPDVWDQKTLHRAWEICRPKTSFLPKTYCQKFDERGADPVIIHYQASRRLAGSIKKE